MRRRSLLPGFVYSRACLLVVELIEPTELCSVVVVRDKTIPTEAARVISTATSIHGRMRGQARDGDPECRLPKQHLLCERFVLRVRVTGMAMRVSATIRRRHQADMQSDVVDRSHAAGTIPHRDITKGRHAAAVCTLPIRNDPYAAPIPANQHVITHLLIIVWMIGLKQAKGLRLADHCFVQHDHHRLHLQHASPRIPDLSFSEIGWVSQLNILCSKAKTLFTGLNHLQRRSSDTAVSQ